ncbi:hypothetical protein SAMN00777080_2810 [Aquiflexum balticum DSM 16537]|uniref:Uncharacterized protein n=1 Tax=Aquiflexum balticum DSM 16537 TaxID=758820 RepID=A0A1W2H6C7_9BACT|nr:hypothetical protein [Aquiflexum balticum]SMD44192.1 hypothetical protein SAMN00777080_2810 [Aquiflexum balticum DSM 16537]
MKIFLVLFFITCCAFGNLHAQVQDKPNLDSLVNAVVKLEKEMYQVNLNLYQSKRQLKTGIFVATLGYTVTIIGGQLLGTNPELGEALLYTGGAIGIAGTVVLVKGFNKISLGPPQKPRHY